jgi:hypothetical protein
VRQSKTLEKKRLKLFSKQFRSPNPNLDLQKHDFFLVEQELVQKEQKDSTKKTLHSSQLHNLTKLVELEFEVCDDMSRDLF